MARISNSDVSREVQGKRPFVTNNKTMEGKWQTYTTLDGQVGRTYAVFSYGNHFPMYVYDQQAGVWVGNKDKYSRTTTNHQNKARPREQIDFWFETEMIRKVVWNGLAPIIASRME